MLNLIKKLREKKELEDKIMRFMIKVDSLNETNPMLAFRYLTQATRLYHEKVNYSQRIDRKFNDIFLSFVSRYTPEFNF